MKLSKNFTLEELTASSTAKARKIDNTPDEKSRTNLYNLAQVLQVIRDEYGKPIIVSSGYRCPKLNTAVGGASNSDHMYGAAADIHSVSDKETDNMELWNVIIKLKNEGKIKCRQIIYEYGTKKYGPSWCHVSINHDKNGKKNNQIVYIGVK